MVHHSDQGVQYTSLYLGTRSEEAGIVPSMESVGSAYDNALAESFIATLKSELLYRDRWPTTEAAKMATFEYIEGFYNRAAGCTRLWAIGVRWALRRVECERVERREEKVSMLSVLPGFR